jgi:gamma-glutamyltranspeptidase/glutathione hydrolase
MQQLAKPCWPSAMAAGRKAVLCLTCLAAHFAIVPTAMLQAVERPVGRDFVTRSVAVGQHGMAATSQPLATLAAIEILKAGGNAIDAAIAANAVLCVTEPTGAGLGGDLFAMVWDAKSKKLYGLNASGRSPQGLTLEEFKRQGITVIPKLGPLTISTPGCVDGWSELHARFGKLPLVDVLAPAIRTAREGYPVTEVIAQAWADGVKDRQDLPGFAETFLIEGQAPKPGQLFRNEPLAATLEKIAVGGSDAFYRGDIARSVDAFMRSVGGFLRFEDLASHRSEWVEPVSVNYRGHDVWELPPNGQGVTALQMLQILQGFDLRKAGFGSADHFHWMIEAKKLAFEDRARFFADPAFAEAPTAGLITPTYADVRRKLVDPLKAAKTFDAGNPALREGDTVYLATADSDRNMVSLIQSNFRGMGSGLCPTGLGFGLQNRGELFDLTPGRANTYAPGKRPFHTIIPAMVTKDGQPVMAFGVMGGDMQPQGHVQILVNLFDFDMGLQEAGDAPRFCHDGSTSPTGVAADPDGGKVMLEPGVPMETVRELIRRGHVVTAAAPPEFGGYQAIWFDAAAGVYTGATESRKDGIALGF